MNTSVAPGSAGSTLPTEMFWYSGKMRSALRWPPFLDPSRSLTTGAQKPSLGIEQATSPYSFRSSELSQPI